VVVRAIASAVGLSVARQVLKWGAGDSFDLSVLLASYLIGVGYDAYVVYGYAPAWICLRDQTHTEVPDMRGQVIEEKRPASAVLGSTMMATQTFKRDDPLLDERAQSKTEGRKSYDLKPKVDYDSKYLRVRDASLCAGPLEP
jgi:hypothetical protein